MSKAIPENVAEMMKTQKQWYISTFGEEPNAVPVMFKEFTPDGKIIVADVFMKVTRENVLKNGKAAITTHNPDTMEGYQIKGSAAYISEGPVFEKVGAVVQEKSGGKLAAKGVVLITPEKVICVTPNPQVNNKEL